MTDSSVTGRNQNHSDVRDESARDNDPLFELSRIFGFDEPAEQKNMQNSQAEPEMSSEMSLERELMADFDAEFAADFAAEPAQPASNFQTAQDEVFSPVQQTATESRSYQQAVEPRFTGYAPLQRAYAEEKAPEQPQPTFQQDIPQYYAEEQDYTAAAPQNAYYEAYSDLPQDAAFSEPVQAVNEDYFSSLESELSQNFEPEAASHAAAEPYYEAPENQYAQPYQAGYGSHAPEYSEVAANVSQEQAAQDFDLPELNTDDFDLSDIGREPQQEFVAQSYDNVFAKNEVYRSVNAAQQPDASFEDELAFLLQDEAPVAASAQTDNYAYEAPFEATPEALSYADPVAAYDDEVVPQTDIEPLFDAPSLEVAPAVADFDGQEPVADHHAHTDLQAEDDYTQAAPVQNYDQIDDEFFAAPDLSRLPNRTVSAQTNWEEDNAADAAETPAASSFADLFGARSQSDYAEETTETYEPEQAVAFEEEQQTENFNFGDDFHEAEENASVAEPAIEQPYVPEPEAPLTYNEPEAPLAYNEPVAPLAHNAVRGYSSYTFGAATPAAATATAAAAGTTERTVSSFADTIAAVPSSYASQPVRDTAPAAASYEEPAYEEPAAADNFFSNDDFDFSFDEDLQPADDFAVAEASEELPLDLDLNDEPEISAYQPAQSAASKPFVPAPEIESVVVSENKVEQTQALDLPEVSYGDDVKETGLNSLESEFAEIFSTISVNEAAAPDTTSEADKAFENILQDNFADYHTTVKAEPEETGSNGAGFGTIAGAAAGLAGAAVAGAALRGSAAQSGAGQTGNATQDDYYNHWAAQGAQNNDFDTYNLSENFARDEDDYTEARPREENPLRKPILWASVAAAALIVLGGGYYMLKSGGVVGGEPAVLRADSQPVKVQPENPGGMVVPNQDKAVYDQVSGTKPAAPEQKTLINTEEEPVDVGLLQGADAEEDRLLSNEPESTNPATPPAANNPAQEAERELVTPRTVKTMVVRADGTIVPSEAPAATAPANNNAAATDNGLDEASRLISQSAVPERLGTDTPAPSAQSAAAPRVVQTQTFTASGEQVKPREVTTAPVVPSRPAEQPVNVVGNVERPAQNTAPQQVASATAPAANVPAGTWFIQIASQPSAELAQKSYANMSSRYGNVIGGRGVDIKRADIAGKGTYYRVRIPGGTKAEAAALCERLKSAGGSCFPTL